MVGEVPLAMMVKMMCDGTCAVFQNGDARRGIKGKSEDFAAGASSESTFHIDLARGGTFTGGGGGHGERHLSVGFHRQPYPNDRNLEPNGK